MFLICRRNIKHVFKHLNENTQIIIDKHNFTIHHKENSHDMK